MVGGTRRTFICTGMGLVVALAGCADEFEGEDVANVVISSGAFDPCLLEVEVDTVVLWENEDDGPHTVTSASDNWDINAELDPGAVVQEEFSSGGVYDAVCTIHGDADEFSGQRMRIAVGDVDYDPLTDC